MIYVVLVTINYNKMMMIMISTTFPMMYFKNDNMNYFVFIGNACVALKVINGMSSITRVLTTIFLCDCAVHY